LTLLAHLLPASPMGCLGGVLIARRDLVRPIKSEVLTGGLAIAALALVFLPERYSDLGQCMYELLSAWGLISQFGFCMKAHPSDN